MNTEVWIAWASFGGTFLLVLVGFLNFTIFVRQLRVAREQIQMALKQLEIARRQPEIQLIQRSITEATDHLRILVEKPYLRPYFYESREWQPGDQASYDEVKAMAELMLNNFASSLMHAVTFPQYPAPGFDRIIMFHLRHSPALCNILVELYDRFPHTGLTLLCLKNSSAQEVEADLNRLISMSAGDEVEYQRRRDQWQLFQKMKDQPAIVFTRHTMNYLITVPANPHQ